MLWLRSALYMTGWALNTVLCAIACMLALPLPYKVRYRVISYWCWFGVWWLGFTCGLKGRVIGQENLPPKAAVVMSKHQSAFETMALQTMLPLTVWVVKRELLWIPFFGWGMWSLRPIALDRSQPHEASRQLIRQGKERLAQGAWIVIFPEGTRVPAGKRGHYKYGGARVACKAGVPVIPVAVNSGEFWPRNSFLKYPGEITVSIGPPISTANKSTDQVGREVETWIEAEMERISGVGPCWPAARKLTDSHSNALAG
ncbi:lysophospholipid acyltransferase family protein [Chitinimonas sp. BJB300]|uniref:lysophospholipid acyltransferase family protein n=1 Tax=Chitinimonas sp. BJB300 TaxID=1559339 RepID=UPI000C11E4D3|nr:lysophospholipid acyltransferase family protein [Chitinimonas sp. BJB300]PHV12788.1 1-acyl-sn-glycerol-3-phosphate acyltransferase [Chitinimonas sp. BJB300]TSJ91343.1 1-acyl-sn-glycerol-3-phosphate acyltransferase [Chitinimonas sp. BJB300]